MLTSHTAQKSVSGSPSNLKKALLFTASTFSTGAIIALLSSSNPASAAPLSWVFQDVTFDDGGILFGSFDYDTETNMYSNFSITVNGGNTTLFPSFSYSPASSFLRDPLEATTLSISSNDSVLVPIPGGGFREDRRTIFIDFDQPLTNTGGSISIQNPAGLGGDAEFNTLPTSPPFGQRAFTNGTVASVPVPEPTSILGLLILGTLGASSAKKRKLQQHKLAISATSNDQ